MWLLYPRRNRNRGTGDLRSPEEHGARLAPEQKKGLRGFDPPRTTTSSAQKEDTRSLSMVQES